MNKDYTSLSVRIKNCHSCFFHNESVQPLAPEDIQYAVDIMFVGENPSWQDGQQKPFDQKTISGQSLDRYYLEPLGLTRSQVWITDLIKCPYPKDIYHRKTSEEARIQNEVVTNCRHWLTEEIALVQPKAIVTLSDKQVYQRLRRLFSLNVPVLFTEAVGKAHDVQIDRLRTILFPMVHPDVARPVESVGDRRKLPVRKKWASIHAQEHIPELKRVLSLLGIH